MSKTMSQKYRLAVANRVAVLIQGKLAGDTKGTHTKVDFTLDMDRLSQTQVDEAGSSSENIADFLARHAHGWNGQTLVIDTETGQPAQFSEDAFRALLDSPGMTLWVYRAFLRDLGVKEKNS